MGIRARGTGRAGIAAADIVYKELVTGAYRTRVVAVDVLGIRGSHAQAIRPKRSGSRQRRRCVLNIHCEARTR
jgi:hypothetical protein